MIVFSNDIQLRKAIHKAIGESLTECLPEFMETIARRVMASDTVSALIQNLVQDELDLRSVTLESPSKTVGRGRALQAVSEICTAYDVSLDDMIGPSRIREIVIPRQHIMYVLATKFSWSYSRIAEFLGGRDNSTIRHGIVRHRERSEERAEMLRQGLSDVSVEPEAFQ